MKAMRDAPRNPETAGARKRKRAAAGQTMPHPKLMAIEYDLRDLKEWLPEGVPQKAFPQSKTDVEFRGHFTKQELAVQKLIEPIIARAKEVIGDRDLAMRWLGTPVRALDFATPISMLATVDGVGKVLDVLGQMEHGVW